MNNRAHSVMQVFQVCLLGILCLALLGAIIFFTAIPSGRAMWNTYDKTLKKVDDATTYEKQKKVEDTCRSMIASYKTDKDIWLQYKDSDNEEKQSWAEQAMMRANRTANTYNEFILKNSFIWSGNVPTDIYQTLPTLEGESK